MKVYITRHGQVLHNVLRKYSIEDDSLTEVGVKQAEDLKEKIKHLHFDIVISSPMKRTLETAQIISHNLPIVTDDRLKERDCAFLDGVSIDDTDREEYWNYYGTHYPECEDIQVFLKRVYSLLDELKTKNYEAVLLVTHSGVTRIVDSYFYGIQDGKLLKRGLKNCEIKEYEFEKLEERLRGM